MKSSRSNLDFGFTNTERKIGGLNEGGGAGLSS
jgi:hypothetical protein